MLCIKNTPIGVVSVFMQFFFKQPECGIPEFFSYNIFYIFVNSPYWFLDMKPCSRAKEMAG